MKPKLMTLLAASTLLALPIAAQTVVIGGTTNNGDLENTSNTAPFLPPGGSSSMDFDHTTGTGSSLKIDLTANNFEGRWKGWADNGASGIEAPVTAGQTITASFWVYIPAATNLGTPQSGEPFNKVVQYIELYNSVADTWPGFDFQGIDIDSMARDTWVQFTMPPLLVPDDHTMLRTRAWNLTTNNMVNGKEAFDTGGDPGNKATPADWQAAGYDGAIYIDDVTLTITDPPPPGIGIQGTINNGDLEAAALSPFGAGGGYQSVSKADMGGINNTPGGNQSLFVDLGVVGGNNQWKGLTEGSHVTMLVNEGDVSRQEVWCNIPAATVLGTNNEMNHVSNLVFRFNTNLDTESGPAPTDLKTQPRDTWFKVSASRTVATGETQVTTSKWYITSGNSGDAALDFSGGIHFDDFELTSFPPPPEETFIGGTINNGDMEAVALAPFGSLGSSIEGTINHTTPAPPATQSMAIDLSAGGATSGRWKNYFASSQTFPVEAGDSISVSMWVYLPASAELGPEDNLFLQAGITVRSDNGGAGNGSIGGVNLGLTGATRDMWHQVEGTFECVDDVNPITSINTSGMNLSSAHDTEAGNNNALLAGYSGSVFIDDFELKISRPQGPEIQITSVSYGEGGFTINYDSRVGPVDLWRNDDGDLSEEGYGGSPLEIGLPGGTGQSFTDTDADASIDPRLFYFLTPEDEDPFNP